MVAQIRTPRVQDGRLPRLLFVLALVVLVGAAAGYFAWSSARQQIVDHGPSGVTVRVPMPPSLPRGPQMPDPPIPTAR